MLPWQRAWLAGGLAGRPAGSVRQNAYIYDENREVGVFRWKSKADLAGMSQNAYIYDEINLPHRRAWRDFGVGLCSSAKRILRILPTAAEVFGMFEIRVVEPRATAISLLIAGGWKLLAACWKLQAGSWCC